MGGGEQMKWIILLILSCTFVSAETFYVATTSCSDSNPGSSDQPWCSIQHAADTMSAGDTTYVREGTYEERVQPARSGNADNYITFVGYWGDEKPIMRGFETNEQDYIKIIGFEMTDTPSHGIVATGSNNIEIINNYIHHTNGHIIRTASWSGIHSSDINIRGNEMYMGQCAPSGSCSGNGWGIQAVDCSNMLFEYNHLHRVADYANFHGDHIIARNNYMHDFQNSYWPQGSGDGLHADMFQPAGSPQDNSEYQVYESNHMGDNIESNSHILQMRSESGLNDHHIFFRGNVGYNHGSYAMQCAGVDNVYYYGNTIDQINTESSWGASACRYNTEGGNNPSLNNHNFNNIFSDIGSGPALNIESGNTVDASHNLCYDTGGHASCESTDDPLYSNKNNRDYHLQSSSPARSLGKPVTTTINSGSGTSVDVVQADLFIDGYGLTEGDMIIIGSDEARITDISGNTITVDRSISWNSGDPVYWRTESTDVGAYPYKSSYDITCSVSYDGNTITATVNDPSLVRFVEFEIDGIPVALVYDQPYDYTWDTSQLEIGSNHRVKAIARPLYADKTLGYSDAEDVVIGEQQEPECGDGNCDANENCTICESDCGECTIDCIHDADNNPCDDVVSTEELSAYIDEWKAGTVTIQDLMGGIVAWKG